MPDFSRVLITGGCGFIGSNLIDLLRRHAPCEIRVLDNCTSGSERDIAGFNVELIVGDIADAAAVAKAVKGVDLVVHLAADTRVVESISAPQRNFQTNVVGTFNLLCSMRELGVSRIVNASTGGAILGEIDPPAHEDIAAAPVSPYGASKLAAEGYCSAFAGVYGFSATSLRFANVYGPRSYHKGSVVAHFFKQLMAHQELVVYGDGTQTRDYVFVEDICDGIMRAMNLAQSGVFQLGTGTPTSLNELIALMQRVVGDDLPVHVRYESFRGGELRRSWCDITKARRVLNFDPKTSLANGLAETWEWFKESR
ncbi:MAG TPA: NAD-dependent epimerase/dehydratase family protein [Candidatus Baltobacteraceae bacterium]